MSDKIYSIDEIQKIVSTIARDYGVERVYLFGSYARGEATEKSDIDLCIDKGQLRGLLKLSGLLSDFSDSLNKPVDLVTSNSLDPAFSDNIRKEVIVLYEQ